MTSRGSRAGLWLKYNHRYFFFFKKTAYFTFSFITDLNKVLVHIYKFIYVQVFARQRLFYLCVFWVYCWIIGPIVTSSSKSISAQKEAGLSKATTAIKILKRKQRVWYFCIYLKKKTKCFTCTSLISPKAIQHLHACSS